MAEYGKSVASATGPRAHSMASLTEDNVEYLLIKLFLMSVKFPSCIHMILFYIFW